MVLCKYNQKSKKSVWLTLLWFSIYCNDLEPNPKNFRGLPALWFEKKKKRERAARVVWTPHTVFIFSQWRLLPSYKNVTPSLLVKFQCSLWSPISLYHLSRCSKETFFCSFEVSEVAQSCLTLCDPMDCSLPGSSVHGIFQASVLEWGAISFSRGSSPPRDWTWVSCIIGRCFTIWATREVNKPTPVLLPGKSNGRRSLVGYSPWGLEESDMTERLHKTCIAV